LHVMNESSRSPVVFNRCADGAGCKTVIPAAVHGEPQ
jgi:hypothetical protein